MTTLVPSMMYSSGYSGLVYALVVPPELESEDGGRLTMVAVVLSTSLLIEMIASILTLESIFIVLRHSLATVEFANLDFSSR